MLLNCLLIHPIHIYTLPVEVYSSPYFQARGGPQRFTVSTWLQIQGLHVSDTGIYSCISHNSFGETSASAQLTVLTQGESLGSCSSQSTAEVAERYCVFSHESFLSVLQWRRKASLSRKRSALIIWKKAVMDSWYLEISLDSFKAVYMTRQQGRKNKFILT